MSRFIRRWHRLLVGLVPVALVLIGCSSTSALRSVGGPGPLGEAAAVVTINVDVTDDSIQPSAIHIPLGKPVQLILRNHGATEHHFIVKGLVPKDLSWAFIPTFDVLPSEMADNDPQHAGHNHTVNFVPYRPASPAGIKLTGKEVHAYAQGSAVDAVLFTATNKGTFTVICPLHPGITATVTVS